MSDIKAIQEQNPEFPFQYSTTSILSTTPQEAFEYLDDPRKLSVHMGKKSWMMVGSKMSLEIDQKDGRAVGSEIIMKGKMMVIRLFLREIISERTPPKNKSWTTIGPQKLIIIDQYRMGFELTPDGRETKLRVFIEYSIPPKGFAHFLGRWFSGIYVRWCAKMMAKDAFRYFSGCTR